MTVATDKPKTPKYKKRKTYRKPRPVCPNCEVMMVCRRTMETVRYFYCPVVGCMESTVQERVDREL